MRKGRVGEREYKNLFSGNFFLEKGKQFHWGIVFLFYACFWKLHQVNQLSATKLYMKFKN